VHRKIFIVLIGVGLILGGIVAIHVGYRALYPGLAVPYA
jgi:hypothetical protein